MTAPETSTGTPRVATVAPDRPDRSGRRGLGHPDTRWQRQERLMLGILLATGAVGGASAMWLDYRLTLTVGIAGALAIVLVAAEPEPTPPRPPTGPFPTVFLLTAGWVSLLLLPELRLVTRGAGRSPHAIVYGSVSIDIVFELTAIAAVGLILGAQLLRGWPTRVPPLVGGLGAFAVLALTSTLWAALPTVTLVRSVQLTVLVLLGAATIGIATADRARARRLLQGVHRWFVLVASVLALYALVSPNWGGRLFIPGTHFIASAVIFAVAFLALLCSRDRRALTWPIPWLPVAGLLLWVVLQTRSRGPLTALICALVTYGVQRARADTRVAAALGSGAGAGAIAAMVFAGGFITTWVLRGQTAEQAGGLTGRRELWSHILDNPVGSQVYGVGYTGNRTAMLGEFTWAGHAHNSWVDLLQTLGVLGIGIMAAVFLVLTVLGLRWDATTTLTLTAFVLVLSLTDDAFAKPGLAMGVIVLAAAWLYVEGRPPAEDPELDGVPSS